MQALDILLVEDDRTQQELLEGFLESLGHRVFPVPYGEEALKVLKEKQVDLVITDYRMGEVSGMDVLREAKKINPEIQVIIITAYGTVENAVEAMKLSAWDYITKPIDLDELEIKLEKLGNYLNLVRENQALRVALRELPRELSIIAESDEMKEILSLVARVADSEAAVFIFGESGTGKEMIARAIHGASRRKDYPFIAVNCAAIPETLFESELFGHEKGAFTGAQELRKGYFELAHRGTLFLDEIGELPPEVQVKLLRVLQEGEFQRLGSSRVLKSDVRVIAATNRDIEKMIQEGKFREDLYYRLNVIPIHLPPLRKRKKDIPPLARHFLKKHAHKNRRPIKGITPDALDLLIRYHFPGNIRELENIIERAVILARTEYITVKDLPLLKLKEEPEVDETTPLPEQVEALEKRLIKSALKKANYVQTKAAELLGISERTLRYKLDKYGFNSRKGED